MQIRCPHCQNPIEMVGLDPAQELTCPSCGSTFSLIDGTSTATYTAPAQKHLGHFELLDQLGVGAFGSVWKARDTELDRVVAIKIPRKDQLNRGEMEQFFREARAAAQLRHPGIVSVHEVGREGDTVYIVSDLIQGITLSDWLSGQKPTPREAAELCMQVAQALHHAHEQGVIHRDLKPSNIMLDDAGQPHLMDFGLAKREAGEITMTLEGQLLGTPAYMSPEQARGEGHIVDRRADIYSLGVLLFQMLTGELPFRGTPRMLMHQVLYSEPRSPRSLNDRIPRDLETICLKAMAKEPGRRYATAQALSDDLQRYLRGEPIQARPVGRIERGWRWSRRNPAMAGLAISCFALVLMAAFTVSAAFIVRARNSAFEAAVAAREAREQKATAQRLDYVSNINMARRAWEAKNISRVQDLLQRSGSPSQENVRGWEWHFLRKSCHLDLRTLVGHVGFVMGVCCSPDGRQLASAGQDGLVKIWDADTGREKRTIKASSLALYCIAFDRAGKRLAASGEDNVLRIWDLETGEERSLTAHSMPVWSIAFSVDGRSLATCGEDGEVLIWDSQTLTSSKLALDRRDPKTCVRFSPDSQGLAFAASDGSVTIWNVANGTSLHRLNGHFGAVYAVEFSPDGKRIATTGQDEIVKLWDLETEAELQTFISRGAAIRSLAFSPGGRKIAAASWDGTVKLLDAVTGGELASFLGHSSSVTSVVFNPNGQLLASASWDGTVKLWATDAYESYRPREATYRNAFRPDGTNLQGLALSETPPPPPPPAPDPPQVSQKVSASHPVVTGPPQTPGVPIEPEQPEQPDEVYAARRGRGFPDTAELLALAARNEGLSPSVPVDGPVGLDFLRQLRGLTSDEPKTVRADLPHAKCVAVANGHTIGVAVAGRSLSLDGHAAPVVSINFSPDGQYLASGSSDRTARLWDLNSGNLVRVVSGHAGPVACVALGPYGRLMATTCGDSQYTIWDGDTGAEKFVFRGHFAPIKSLAFSPDGKRVASASLDGTVLLADAETGSELFSIPFAGYVAVVRFSHDGRWLGINVDGNVQLFDSKYFSPDEKMGRFLAGQMLSRHTEPNRALDEIRNQTHWNEAMREAASAAINVSKDR